MARPRQPAQILQLRGSHRAHPERARTDPEGCGPFDPTPPPYLPMPVQRAWTHLVERLPHIALSASDSVCIEQAARVLAGLWHLDSTLGPHAATTREFKALNDALARWLGVLGMTPAARANFAAPRDPKASGFAKLRDMDDEP